MADIAIRYQTETFQRSGRGCDITYTAEAGDTWVVGFFHAGGTFQYIKFDGTSVTGYLYSPHSQHHYAIIENVSAGSHTITTYTDNGSWTCTSLWVLTGCASVCYLDSDTDAAIVYDQQVDITMTSQNGGICLYLAFHTDHTHGYAWASSVTDDGTYHETDSSPWPTMACGHKHATTTTCTGSRTDDQWKYYVETMRISGISIKNITVYPSTPSGGVTPAATAAKKAKKDLTVHKRFV